MVVVKETTRQGQAGCIRANVSCAKLGQSPIVWAVHGGVQATGHPGYLFPESVVTV